MKKIILVLMCIIFSNIVYSKEKIVIKMSEYPPYVMKNGKGIALDIVKEIYKDSKFEIEYIEVPRRRTETEFFSRKSYYNFGPKYVLNRISKDEIKYIEYRKIIDVRLIVNYNKKYRKNLKFEIEDNLKGLKAGVILGTPYSTLYKKLGLITEEAQDVKNSYLKLYKGRVDVVPGFDITSRMIIMNLFHGDKNIIELEKEIATDDFGIFFHKANPNYKEIVLEFDRGMKRIKENGKYLEIVEKYYGKGKIPKNILRFIKE